jgi:radical SAM protein with 4Fe4S-binding SPASM domain
MKLRLEPFGAWVKLETTPAIVALDRDGVRALGLDGGARWQEGAPPSPPIEVHLAVTHKCAAGCDGCYLDARPDGVEPPRAELLSRLDALRDAGVMTVAFGGGEPLTREDLGVLADEARARGLTPVLTTSGFGLSEEKARRLHSFAQVNVSYDGAREAYSLVRGFDGARAAEAAIALLSKAEVRTGVNVVLTRATLPMLTGTLRRAKELGASEAQLLRYKPAGRGASAEYMARRLSPSQVSTLGATLRALTLEHARDGFSIRIDCSMVPFLSADAALYGDPQALARAGVFGCEGGQALSAVKVDGRVAPCSFVGTTELPVTELVARHASDPELTRWRLYPSSAPEPCASCALREVCKGGCKAVSLFVDGAIGPDPECPRVVAYRTSQLPPPRLADATTDTHA